MRAWVLGDGPECTTRARVVDMSGCRTEASRTLRNALAAHGLIIQGGGGDAPRGGRYLLERVLHDLGRVNVVARDYDALFDRLLEEAQEVLLCDFPRVRLVLVWIFRI